MLFFEISRILIFLLVSPPLASMIFCMRCCILSSEIYSDPSSVSSGFALLVGMRPYSSKSLMLRLPFRGFGCSSLASRVACFGVLLLPFRVCFFSIDVASIFLSSSLAFLSLFCCSSASLSSLAYLCYFASFSCFYLSCLSLSFCSFCSFWSFASFESLCSDLPSSALRSHFLSNS